MKKNLSLKEIQNEEKELLRKTVEYLDKNNIEYYISYGTMLGAIRHKGFIPWDDDIDISMTRNNFEKLIDIAKHKNTIDNDLEIQSYELGNSVYPFIKIINKKIFLEDNISVDQNLWIDVFPLDGLPSDEKKIKKIMNKTFKMAELYMVKNFKYKEIPKTTRSNKATIIKYLAKPVTIFINKEKWMQKYLKVAKSYDVNSSKKITSVVWHGKKIIVFPKEILESEIYNFEDIKVKGFKDYDNYLKACYGDYMKLPPENERNTHNIKAYIKK